jgi:hypothetical protein
MLSFWNKNADETARAFILKDSKKWCWKRGELLKHYCAFVKG